MTNFAEIGQLLAESADDHQRNLQAFAASSPDAAHVLAAAGYVLVDDEVHPIPGWADLTEEERALRREEDRGEFATILELPESVFGDFTSGDPAPPRRVTPGRNRTSSGRVGAPPKHPVVRKWRPGVKPERTPEGEAKPVPEPPKPARVEVPKDLRPKVAAGTVNGVLLEAQPTFEAGQLVPLGRYTRDGERDPEVIVEVQSLEWLAARDVKGSHARAAGYGGLSDWIKLRYRNVKVAKRQAAFEADEAPVWFALVVPSRLTMDSVPFVLDDERGRAAEGVVGARWLAPSGSGDAKGYAETPLPSRAMLDAGVCVPEEYQRQRCEEAIPSIERGLVKGVKKSAESREKFTKVHRSVDSSKGHAARGGRRRPPRSATLRPERREEASAEEVAAYMASGVDRVVAAVGGLRAVDIDHVLITAEGVNVVLREAA